MEIHQVEIHQVEIHQVDFSDVTLVGEDGKEKFVDDLAIPMAVWSTACWW